MELTTCLISRAVCHAFSGIKLSKCFLAADILSCVRVVEIFELAPVIMTMMYVLTVNMSMNAVNCEFLTSIPSNWDRDLEQLILNCLMMLEILSNR